MSDAVMSLAGDFDLAGRDQWMALVEQVLRGAPFDKKLVHTTYDGIAIQPLYTGADHAGDPSLPGVAPFTRGSRAAGGAWQVRQAHAPATGNEAVLADLDGGVDAIELLVDGSSSVDEIDRLLRGVPDSVPVMLGPGSEAADALVGLWGRRGVTPAEARGGFGADAADPRVGAAVSRSLDYPDVVAAVANGARLADQGASEAQELAGSLAHGVAYLRACEDAGIDLGEAAAKLEFRYAAGVDQFLTMAKLRAARRLWARVTQVCGIEPAVQRQHAVTAGAMMSRRDPWVNLIRTTVACFAAAAGGADAITVSPYDAAIGAPDPLGLRIARNTQLLLREESHIDQVIDPAGGSYYAESLTDALAATAWGLFQELEAGANLTECIEAAHAARSRDVATRRLPLTGISEFPDLDEPEVERPPMKGVPGLRRLAEPFEALRDAADAAPSRPTAFLANLGPMAVHSARAAFAANLLAAGGIGVLGNDGFDTPEEAVAAWAASGSLIAVVCSSDEVYQENAAAAVAALKEAGCGYVLLAGRPDDRWGADGCIYMGCDAIAALRFLHERLGL
ncbi:methylmalonyl-CoA mutase family protein [Candidatus Poriferisocius sp.]|uniref:methylmalonyl-CoA mutase family protein n=1 Tax=Candidatus Poriferisocius sp. TaxID=3101276 RepID=UPI003B0287A2